MSLKAILLGLGFAAPLVWAQATEWQQCGGINWTGPTTCSSGLTCYEWNPWYFQCLRASSSSLSLSSTSQSSGTSSYTSSTSSHTSSSSTQSSTSSAPSVSGTATVKTWFSFGDSYTQTGFSVTGTQPSVNNPFGNPPYPGYTACGSVPNWVDYLATIYNTTTVQVYNHAYGGATIDAALVQPYTSTVLSLVDQANNFLDYNAPGKQYYNGWSSANTLFSVWIGINDIGNSWYLSGDRAAFSDTLLDRYFQLMQSLYAVGARHFLFLTVPPIQRSPLMLQQPISSQQGEAVVIDGFNAKLVTRAAAFAAAHTGATAQVYDTTTIVNAMLDDPSAYGLQDATSYGSGNMVAWCNDYHISPPVHNQVANGVANLVAGTYI